MFTTSTSSAFAITLCTMNTTRDLAKSNNSGIASSGLERWLHNTMEETMAVCSKTRWKPNHPDIYITKLAYSSSLCFIAPAPNVAAAVLHWFLAIVFWVCDYMGIKAAIIKWRKLLQTRCPSFQRKYTWFGETWFVNCARKRLECTSHLGPQF